MTRFLQIISVFFLITVNAQEVEVYTGISDSLSLAAEEKSVELFGKGLLDYGFEGQLQAAAQAVKINVGEPNGFYLPIYLLVGATSGDFGSSEINKGTVMNLINPTGGTFNLSTNVYVKLFSSESGITSLKFNSYLAGKLISGRNLVDNSAQMKPSGYFDSGLFFQTGAWVDEDGYKDGGIFWIQAKYSLSYMDKEDLQSYFGPSVTTAPHGPRVEIGCLIEGRVNIKLSYYKSADRDEVPTLNDSQFRIALDYSVL